MAKIGRNDPCPCGSGKKYKRCCIDRDASAFSFTQEECETAIYKLAGFVEAELPMVMDEAHDTLYDQWKNRMVDLDTRWFQLSEAFFEMWLFFDFRLPDGYLVVDRFLDQDMLISPGERRFLKLLSNTAVRLYEVADLSPGQSVTLRDVLDSTEVTVHERLGSRSMHRHMLIAARVMERGSSGQPEIMSGMIQIPELIRPQTISQLSSHRKTYRCKHPGASDIDFFKEMGPFFHDAWMTCLLDPPIPQLTNTDGEDVVPTSIRFDVISQADLESAMDSAKELERQEESVTTWLWTGKNRSRKIVTLGHLTLKGKILSWSATRSSAESGDAR